MHAQHPPIPISAWPCHVRAARRTRQAGFTLLEMLVVLVIAGIMAGAASLTLSRNPRSELLEQGQRLALLFESADDEAQVRGHPLAWEADAHGYRFVERQADSWRVMHDDLFAAQRWTLPMADVAIRYAGSQDSASQLAFGIESINLPVVVTLYSPAGQLQIVSTGNGRFVVH